MAIPYKPKATESDAAPSTTGESGADPVDTSSVPTAEKDETSNTENGTSATTRLGETDAATTDTRKGTTTTTRLEDTEAAAIDTETGTPTSNDPKQAETSAADIKTEATAPDPILEEQTEATTAETETGTTTPDPRLGEKAETVATDTDTESRTNNDPGLEETEAAAVDIETGTTAPDPSLGEDAETAVTDTETGTTTSNGPGLEDTETAATDIETTTTTSDPGFGEEAESGATEGTETGIAAPDPEHEGTEATAADIETGTTAPDPVQAEMTGAKTENGTTAPDCRFKEEAGAATAHIKIGTTTPDPGLGETEAPATDIDTWKTRVGWEPGTEAVDIGTPRNTTDTGNREDNGAEGSITNLGFEEGARTDKTDPRPEENTEATAANGGPPMVETATIESALSASHRQTSPDASTDSLVRDLETTGTGPDNQPPAAPELCPGSGPAAGEEPSESGLGAGATGSDTELRYLAVMVQLEQLAKLLDESAFQFANAPAGDTAESTAAAVEGTEGKNTNVNDIEANDIDDIEVNGIHGNGIHSDTAEANGADANGMSVNVAAKNTEAKADAEQHVEEKDTEVRNGKIRAAEASAAEVNEGEANVTEVKDAEVEDAEVRSDADVRGAEMKVAEVQDPNVRDAEANSAKVNGAEVNAAETNNVEVAGAESNGAEANGAAFNGTEVNAANRKEAEMNGSAEKDVESEDIEVKNNCASGTGGSSTKVNGVQVSSTEQNAALTDPKAAAELKRNRTRYAELTALLAAACIHLEGRTPWSVNFKIERLPLPIGQPPRAFRPPPGYELLPPLVWPVSAQLERWTARPVEVSRPPSEDRARPDGAPAESRARDQGDDPGTQPELDDTGSKPTGGARRKTCVEKKSQSKSVPTSQVPVRRNGTSNGNHSLSKESLSHGAAELEPTQSSTAASPASYASDRLTHGRASPRQLRAVLSAFQRRSRATCAALARRRRPPDDPVPWERPCTVEERQRRDAAWWRRQVQRDVRYGDRVGHWFDRRFERGDVLFDPPPPTNYTGFSTARASDFKSLDPEQFSRSMGVPLGFLWDRKSVDRNCQNPQGAVGVPKVQRPSSATARGAASEAGQNPGNARRVAAKNKKQTRAAPAAAPSMAASDAGSATPKKLREDDRENRVEAKTASGSRSPDGEQDRDGERLDAVEEMRVRVMEEFTERHLRLGGSLTDILDVVDSPQKLANAALEKGKTDSDVVEKKAVERGIPVRETGEKDEDDTDRTNSAVRRQPKRKLDEAQDTSETTDTEDGNACAAGGHDVKSDDSSGIAREGTTSHGASEASLKVSVTMAGNTDEVAVLEATAMELDEERVFGGVHQTDHFESMLSDIDDRMKQACRSSEQLRLESGSVTGDVEQVRQALPQMDQMFASLQSISAAVLSAARAKEAGDRRETPEGEDAVKFPASESKPADMPKKSSRKKKGGRKLQAQTSDAAASKQDKNGPDRRVNMDSSPNDEASASPKLKTNTQSSPPASSGAKPRKKSTRRTTKSSSSTPAEPRVEVAEADSTSEYPCLVGPLELRPVEGIPPRGTYVAQHKHLLQPAESEFARCLTGEERTDLLSPLGRLALAMPQRFMSSKQLLEVHELLQSQGCADDPRAIEALLRVERSAGDHISTVHQFFQLGCDRRYHHVELRGKPMAFSKIVSCDMLAFLRENQWQWPALVSPNTFLSGRGSGDGIAPNAFRTYAEIESHIEVGDMVRVSGITAYIRTVVRHLCQGLVCRLERRPVSCAEEKEAVSSLVSVLLHRMQEATHEPAGIVMVYSLHNDSLLEGEMRHTNRYVKLRCESHAALVGCSSWSCRLWLWMLFETCRLSVEGETQFAQMIYHQQRVKEEEERQSPRRGAANRKPRH
ncbi:uncharacterized protein LOC122363341 [Amphibalanus amphitrite]|uniref:uncharacterized protein LOC122363341 n=1 Tax=Amphibalanus amphitrite TaxID=1232801 RepID=UPI001C919E18|nr:uncharacterized protein LOC122363341 [Amphibalanus amphitrite]